MATSSSSVDAVHDFHIDHRVRKFLKDLASSDAKPIEELSPAEARQVLIDAQQSVDVDLPPCDIEEITISQDGRTIPLTIVRPQGQSIPLPAFMFFHGGGWVLGDFPTHERLVRDLVSGSGAVAIFVNYTPSPEAAYPVAIHEAYTATKWVAEHGHEIDVQGTRLAVAGNSVGGNMATVVALMAKDRGGPEICFQLLMWPVTDADFDTDSYHQFAEGRFLTRKMMQWFWDNYTQNPLERAEMYASPLRGMTEELQGLAPALIQVAENDVLRDEGEEYGRKLDAAGVDVTTVRYNGMIHDWGLLNPLTEVPGTRDAMLQASSALRQALFSKM